MPLKLNRQEFLAALKLAASSTDKKISAESGGAPGHVLFRGVGKGSVIVAGTTLQVTTQTRVRVIDGSADDVDIMFDPRILIDILKACTVENVSIDPNVVGTSIKAGNASFSIHAIKGSMFPRIPVVSVAENVNAPAIASLLDRVVHAAGTDDSRPHLTNIRLNLSPCVDGGTRVEAEATNGHCIVSDVIHVDEQHAASVLYIPRESARVLIKAVESSGVVNVFGWNTDGDTISLTAGPSSVSVKKSSHILPNTASVYANAWGSSVQCEKGPLVMSLQRVLTISEGAVKLVVSEANDSLTISAASDTKGEARDSLTVEGEGSGGHKATLSGRYLLTIIERTMVSDEPIALRIHKDEMAPIALSQGDNTRAVIMPIRV